MKKIITVISMSFAIQLNAVEIDASRVTIEPSQGQIAVDHQSFCWIRKEKIQEAMLFKREAELKGAPIDFDLSKCSVTQSKAINSPGENYSPDRFYSSYGGNSLSFDSKEVCSNRNERHDLVIQLAKLTNTKIKFDVRNCKLSLAETGDQIRIRELEGRVKQLEAEALVCNSARVNDSSAIKDLKNATVPVIKKAGQSRQ